MAKMIEKHDLKFIDGYLVSANDDIIGVPEAIVVKLNAIETTYQKAKFLANQPAGVSAPSLKGFERESAFPTFVPPAPATPLLDKQVEESLAWLAESNAINEHKLVAMYVRNNQDVFAWVDGERFIGKESQDRPFDLPTLGNPLNLTKEDLLEIITELAKVEVPGGLVS